MITRDLQQAEMALQTKSPSRSDLSHFQYAQKVEGGKDNDLIYSRVPKLKTQASPLHTIT